MVLKVLEECWNTASFISYTCFCLGQCLQNCSKVTYCRTGNCSANWGDLETHTMFMCVCVLGAWWWECFAQQHMGIKTSVWCLSLYNCTRQRRQTVGELVSCKIIKSLEAPWMFELRYRLHSRCQCLGPEVLKFSMIIPLEIFYILSGFNTNVHVCYWDFMW